jgi:hypothetical protein
MSTFFALGTKVLPIASATDRRIETPTDRAAGACRPDPIDGSVVRAPVPSGARTPVRMSAGRARQDGGDDVGGVAVE